MRLSCLATIVIVSLCLCPPSLAKQADILANGTECISYSNPMENDNIYWSDENLVFDKPVVTYDAFGMEIMTFEGDVTVKHKHWYRTDHYHYHHKAVLHRNIKDASYIQTDLTSKKGAGQKWKFNLKDDKGNVLIMFWLASNDWCSNGKLDWSRLELGGKAVQATQLSVQHQKNEVERTS